MFGLRLCPECRQRGASRTVSAAEHLGNGSRRKELASQLAGALDRTAMSPRSSISMFASVLALAALPSHAVQAQLPSGGAQQDCNALVDALPAIQRTVQTTVNPEGDGCRITSFRISPGPSGSLDTGLLIERADASGADLVRAATSQRFPEWLKLELRGVRVDVKTGKPGLDYLNRRQQKPFNVRLSYRSDKATGAIRLEEASIAGEKLGDLHLDATIYGLDLSAMKVGEGPDLPSLRIGQLALRLDDKAMTTTFLLPLIVARIGFDQDPVPVFEAYRKQAVDMLDLLPGSFLPTASRNALARFIGDFPDPSGPLALTAKAEPPFAIVRLGMLGGATEPDDIRQRLVRMLGEAKLEASYAPTR